MPHFLRSALALLLSVVLTLAASAVARAVTVGDAYATAGANQCTWTIGTAATEKVLTFSSGTYTLTSFKNKLASPVREYVGSSPPRRSASTGTAPRSRARRPAGRAAPAARRAERSAGSRSCSST